ncbi:hypothetical protein EZV62_010725 [Acer yangbiense]|uniref:G protein gamma domain-containing protein n=1 Tax=Acer yangbiense TaxID=1000413 RepID=A0A5C7I3A7_9ROSI|nr:hypothetical protein EZV62_010725 [Acer yangbiense]
MDSETASSVDEQVVASRRGPDTAGKHRILAKPKRVEQESRFLEEELEELDKSESISTICEGAVNVIRHMVRNSLELICGMLLSFKLLRLIEVRPDPLLPITNGHVNPVWDRWFEGPQDAQGCRCLIL